MQIVSTRDNLYEMSKPIWKKKNNIINVSSAELTYRVIKVKTITNNKIVKLQVANSYVATHVRLVKLNWWTVLWVIVMLMMVGAQTRFTGSKPRLQPMQLRITYTYMFDPRSGKQCGVLLRLIWHTVCSGVCDEPSQSAFYVNLYRAVIGPSG